MRRIVAIVLIYLAANFGAAYFFRRQRRAYAGARRHFLVTQGGSDLRPSGPEVDDAVVSVFMGGLILDLRETQLASRPARLDLLAVMGGVELLVPEEWKVRVEVEPAMGGVQDRRRGEVDPERPDDLVVSGRLVMAGLDIGHEPHARARGGRSPRAELAAGRGRSRAGV